MSMNETVNQRILAIDAEIGILFPNGTPPTRIVARLAAEGITTDVNYVQQVLNERNPVIPAPPDLPNLAISNKPVKAEPSADSVRDLMYRPEEHSDDSTPLPANGESEGLTLKELVKHTPTLSPAKLRDLLHTPPSLFPHVVITPPAKKGAAYRYLIDIPALKKWVSEND